MDVSTLCKMNKLKKQISYISVKEKNAFSPLLALPEKKWLAKLSKAIASQFRYLAMQIISNTKF